MSVLAQTNPIYQPAMRIITGISNERRAVVTTSFEHDYINGLIIRLDVPREYGMQQISGQFGEITVLSPTTFAITIDSTDYDIFVNQPTGPQYAQSVPIGERNDQLTGATVNTLTR